MSKQNLSDIRRELRELVSSGKIFVRQPSHRGPTDGWREGLGERKAARWIRTPVTPENAYLRWNSFRRINSELQPWVAQRRQQVLEFQSQIQRELRHEKVLGSREYAFCLYPESDLRGFLNAQL